MSCYKDSSIGIGCLDEQFQMNLESFESDVPMCKFNITPFTCRSEPTCIEEFRQRKDRILCKYHPYGKPVCNSTEQYFYWDGGNLKEIGELVLFKSRADAQLFLENHFAVWCEKYRNLLKDKEINNDEIDYYWNVKVETLVFLTGYLAITEDETLKTKLQQEINELDTLIRQKCDNKEFNTFPDVIVNNKILMALHPPTKPENWWYRCRYQ